MLVPVAAADHVAEGPTLESQPAAGAGGRQELGLHEEGPHQARPEEHEAEDEEGVHLASIGTRTPWDKIHLVSWLYIALLALAVAVFAGAEWPRLAPRFGADSRKRRQRARRKATLRVVETDADDFAASVERDLANLPTIEETDRR